MNNFGNLKVPVLLALGKGYIHCGIKRRASVKGA